jgi:beta-lactamase class D
MQNARRFPPAVLALFALMAGPLGSAPGAAAPRKPSPPLEATSLFEKNAGCAVLRDLATGEERRGGALCDTALSPCSTFKIPNALIGLDAGVMKDEHHRFGWDGKPRWREEWNHEMDLGEALRVSCVPCFQELARAIGAARLQKKVDAFSYGNRDLSGGLDRFWLGSSLAISPREQARFAADLWRDRLPISKAAGATVRRLLRQDGGEAWSWSGKTGSCTANARVKVPHGWFVGEAERGGRRIAFAVLEQGEGAMGTRSRELARRLLVREGMLPETAK